MQSEKCYPRKRKYLRCIRRYKETHIEYINPVSKTIVAELHEYSLHKLYRP